MEEIVEAIAELTLAVVMFGVVILTVIVILAITRR